MPCFAGAGILPAGRSSGGASGALPLIMTVGFWFCPGRGADRGEDAGIGAEIEPPDPGAVGGAAYGGGIPYAGTGGADIGIAPCDAGCGATIGGSCMASWYVAFDGVAARIGGGDGR